LPTATPSLRNSGIVGDLNGGRRTEAYPILEHLLTGRDLDELWALRIAAA
jgi:hypothetical protein